MWGKNIDMNDKSFFLITRTISHPILTLTWSQVYLRIHSNHHQISSRTKSSLTNICLLFEIWQCKIQAGQSTCLYHLIHSTISYYTLTFFTALTESVVPPKLIFRDKIGIRFCIITKSTAKSLHIDQNTFTSWNHLLVSDMPFSVNSQQ